MIQFEATGTTPRVDFNENGILKLDGHSLPEDTKKFYDPLVEYVKNLKSTEIIFSIKLEYFNTSSAKMLWMLLKAADKNNHATKVLVNWFYEEGDDESYESAEMYKQDLSRTEFKYFVYAETADNFTI